MFETSMRSCHCGDLRLSDAGRSVNMVGWVQHVRDLGGMTFIDLRDRYGITQLVFYHDPELMKQGIRRYVANFEQFVENIDVFEAAKDLKREYVIQVEGIVVERESKNPKNPTGDIELLVTGLTVLNASKVPPFTIEDDTDGGEELRMRYRYLDLRRNPLRENLVLRHHMGIETRKYLDSVGFLEIETPFLIKSTPEGARDFVVPSRVHQGKFYALPQSPQTFKQLLMVSGFDRYYQIVRCFRDEDLRADRQPEFTQIDCEMSFVERDDVLDTFEGLARHLFKTIKEVDPGTFPKMSFHDAMKYYGSDKPDIRFEMKFVELNGLLKGKGFKVFDDAELVVGICAEGCGEYSRKQIDQLTEFVKKPQIGARGLVYIQNKPDGTLRSSVDKFYSPEQLKEVLEAFQAPANSMVLILAGETNKTRKALNELRLEMGNRLGLRDPEVFKPLWVVDFPMFEYDDEEGRFYAMHHPFTSPKFEIIDEDSIEDKLLYLKQTNPANLLANAYDLVINGVEIGGGSIRIHDKSIQKRVFEILGFTEEEAQAQFGFLMNAFEYGAPPHGGIAFGFDRWTSLFGGSETIRDFIAFPKNNAGQDVMIESPSEISKEQLKELGIKD